MIILVEDCNHRFHINLQSRNLLRCCRCSSCFRVWNIYIRNYRGSYKYIFVTDSISQYNGEDISCYNGDDGKIFAHVYGGIPPYTFNWSNGITNISNNDIDSLINLSDTIYSVIVSDANGCIASVISDFK